MPGPLDGLKSLDLNQYLLNRRQGSMGEKAPDPYHDYAGEQFQREDGTTKGKGFLGVFPINGPDPGVMSEYSIADSENGPDYPSLVPTLNEAELNQVLNQHVSPTVHNKARAFAALRQHQNKSVFAQAGEQQDGVSLPDAFPMFRRIR